MRPLSVTATAPTVKFTLPVTFDVVVLDVVITPLADVLVVIVGASSVDVAVIVVAPAAENVAASSLIFATPVESVSAVAAEGVTTAKSGVATTKDTRALDTGTPLASLIVADTMAPLPAEIDVLLAPVTGSAIDMLSVGAMTVVVAVPVVVPVVDGVLVTPEPPPPPQPEIKATAATNRNDVQNLFILLLEKKLST